MDKRKNKGKYKRRQLTEILNLTVLELKFLDNRNSYKQQ